MERIEVLQAIEDVDARVRALRARIEVNAEKLLLSGEWRVRDALSHLAARSNSVPNVMRRLVASESQSAGTAPRVNIDEINHDQVDERSGRSIQEILDEIHAGHRTAILSLPVDEMLARTLPAVGGGDVSIAESIARSGARHEQNHLNDVEAALDG